MGNILTFFATGAGAELIKRFVGFVWEKAPLINRYAAQSRVPADTTKEILFELANFHIPNIYNCASLAQGNSTCQTIENELLQDLGVALVKRQRPSWNPKATFLVPEASFWRIKSHYGHTHEEIRCLNLKIDGSVAGICYRHMKTIIVPDVERERTYVPQSFDKGTKSLICVPVKCENLVYGVLNATSEKINSFSVADEGLLWCVASALSIVESLSCKCLLKIKETGQTSVEKTK